MIERNDGLHAFESVLLAQERGQKLIDERIDCEPARIERRLEWQLQVNATIIALPDQVRVNKRRRRRSDLYSSPLRNTFSSPSLCRDHSSCSGAGRALDAESFNTRRMRVRLSKRSPRG